jgi:small subunit ribosomal protein S21
MVEVIIEENDRLDWALKQFQRKVIRSGILKDVRRKRFYVKPSEARQHKQDAAKRRQARAQRNAR